MKRIKSGNVRLSATIWIQKHDGTYTKVPRDDGHLSIQMGLARPCNRKLVKQLKSEGWVEKEGVLHEGKTAKRSSS